MKQILFPVSALLFCAVMAFGQSESGSPNQSKQLKGIFTALPMKSAGQISREDVLKQAAAGSTIPFWNYNIVSPLDRKSYSGTMVGRSPFFNGHRTTIVNTDMVPVILTFADSGTVFDPTTSDSCLGDSVLNVVVNSPMFKNLDYIMNGADVGSTQYVDAFQRANFWSKVHGTPYHTLLGGKVLPAIHVTVPAANGSTNISDFGCLFGEMDINWWDNYLQQTIFPKLAAQGVSPQLFPIFLFDSVFEYDGALCCILGYHSAYLSNNVVQTYSISSYDTSGAFGGDISVSSHEIAEWMDDPQVNNLTPAWGHVGQVSGCAANLEVGDPLTGTDFGTVTLNGNTYTLQELAFFSWFFRQTPSSGSGGLDSNNGSFHSGQPAICH